MKYIAAYLLLVTGGKTAPSTADIKSLLKSLSIDSDDEKIIKLLSEVEGKSVEELIATGIEKLSSVPAGAAAPSGASTSDNIEKAAEEEKEEEKEESDDDMGFGLFD